MYHNDYELLSLQNIQLLICTLLTSFYHFLKFSDINMTFKDHQKLLVLWIRELKNLNNSNIPSVSSVAQSCLFVTPWTTTCQASLSITNSRSLLKLMSIRSVIPSNHFILCCPLLLPPSVFPSIRVFSSESAFHIKWPKYWSFSFSISPSSEYSGLISFRMD